MTSRQWITKSAERIPQPILAFAGGNAVVARRLAEFATLDGARAFLDPSHYRPSSPFDLPDMQAAVERIQHAIESGERICIWGDFDVDGQTSTALLVSAFTTFGADVNFYIPHREREGHGVHLPRLATLIADGVKLIVTCDTGVAAHTAIDFARGQGVDVVVTDHHQLPDTLPNAVAVVNPQRLDPQHPLYTLPGVGCAYKLVEALYAGAGRSDGTETLLDLVALGIVADVAVLHGDTRYLLQCGLDVLRNTSRTGLQLLYEEAGINSINIDEETIGFEIAPRLNAVGRLADANISVEFLTTDDVERARVLVGQLEGLNAQRRNMTTQVHEAALKQLDDDPTILRHNALVLGHPRWPGGIVGIVANRLVEQFDRPVVLLITPEGELARGSARSVDGVDISAAISQQADLLNAFGGHTMAAGLSLMPEHIPEFRRRLSRTVGEMLAGTERLPQLEIDAFVSLDEITPDYFEQLQQLAPFGPGNPRPVLAAGALTTLQKTPMGKSDEHHRIQFHDENGIVNEVVWWRSDIESFPKGRFDLAFTLHTNQYRGEQRLQLQYVDARPVDEAPQQFAHRTGVEIIDYRNAADPIGLLKSLTDVLIWAEGDADSVPGALRRDKLESASQLAIWTAPPDAAALNFVLETVNPGKVYLFGVNPRMDSVQGFIQRLTGLVKYALANTDGKATWLALEGALAHNQATVRAGLNWLAARGHVHIVEEDTESLTLTTQPMSTDLDKTETTTKLAALLAEAAAYRAYFLKADPKTLITL